MPTPSETAEHTAERLAPTAVALVLRLRSEPAEQLRRDLLGGLSDRDRDGLIMLLAAAVDPNAPPDVWWGWVRYGRELAAASRLEVSDPAAGLPEGVAA